VIFLLYHGALCLYGAYLALFAVAGLTAERQLFSAVFVDAAGAQFQASTALVLQVRGSALFVPCLCAFCLGCRFC
jgi:hypothetical protein